jgi:hypothetical protein
MSEGMDRDRDIALDVYRAVRAHELELNRAAVQFEHATLAPLLLLNGGAAVAFLALLGATSETDAALNASTNWAVAACAFWAIGLAAATLATYLAFQSQRHYTRVERLRREDVERLLLEGHSMAEIVAPPDPEDRTVRGERAKGWERQKQFHWAAGFSLLAFVVGGVLAGVAVL